MTTHGSVAKRAREAKERNPTLFCSDKRCLWRLTSGACPRHPVRIGFDPGHEERTIETEVEMTPDGPRVVSEREL